MNTKNDIFIRIYRRYNAFDLKKIAIVVLLIYSLLIIVGFMIHEKTPDEAKAWLIARDASFFDMLFVIPKYEGHPPFWHLILSIPSKLGFDYDLSMCIIQFMSSALMCMSFLLLTPFNNWIKTLVPFTYYFFYRWGIYQRPYALLSVGLIVASYAYKKRKEKPLMFIASLAFLCLWSSYGIVIAGGIACAWIVELFLDEWNKGHKWYIVLMRVLYNRRRTAGLVILLLFAFFNIFLIVPAKDNYMFTDASTTEIMALVKRIAKLIFFLPSETFFTSFVKTNTYFHSYNFSVEEMILCTFLSFIFYCFIFIMGKKDKILFFVLPFIFFIVVASQYLYMHHFGIVLFITVFYLAVCRENSNPSDKTKEGISKVFSAIVVIAFCAFGIYWSFNSFMCDMVYDCTKGGKVTAAFIKENNLSNLTLDCAWYILINDKGEMYYNRPESAIYTFTLAAPYFVGNHVRNSIDGITYNLTIEYTDAKINNFMEEVKRLESPDLLYAMDTYWADNYIMTIGLEESYVPVLYTNEVVPSKGDEMFYTGGILYARSDIADKYGLDTVSPP